MYFLWMWFSPLKWGVIGGISQILSRWWGCISAQPLAECSKSETELLGQWASWYSVRVNCSYFKRQPLHSKDKTSNYIISNLCSLIPTVTQNCLSGGCSGSLYLRMILHKYRYSGFAEGLLMWLFLGPLRLFHKHNPHLYITTFRFPECT